WPQLHRRICWIADLDGFGFCCQFLYELVIDFFVNDLAATADACLARADKRAECRKIYSLVYVEIVKHEYRCFATKFKGLMGKVRSCHSTCDAPGLSASCKHPFCESGVLGKRFACCGAKAGHNVKDAW